MRKIAENGKEISEAKLKELKENARGILADCRRAFLNEFPFYGTILMNMEIVPTRDVRLSTAACDGRTIYFDIDFLSSLSPEQQKFILAHECMHAVMNTPLRCEGRAHDPFNIAADIEINQILKKDGLCVCPDACMPEKYGLPPDLSAEEYYERLVQDMAQKSKCKNSPSSGAGCGSDGSSESGNSESQSGSESQNNSGNKEGKLEGQFDKHITKDDNIASEPTPDNVCDKYGKVGVDKDYYPEVSQENAEKMREAAISAAQAYEKQRGELPEHLKKFVADLLTPEISWKEVLQSFVTRTIGDEADWNRPNRRFVSSGVYLPSHKGETVKIGVVIDTSGSTRNFIKKFLSEVNGIVSTFTGYEIHLIQCDADVKSCVTYNDDNPLNLETSKFEIEGGGGTILYPAFERIEEDELDVDGVVVFTDGETEHFTDSMDPGYPVLWVLTNDQTKMNFDFGETCVFKDDKSSI